MLKPSVRRSNGYRLYSKDDLLRQKQIVTLKSFGFELSQIQDLLCGDIDIMEHLGEQLRFLEEEISNLSDASEVLKNVIYQCENDKLVRCETIINSLKKYDMV